jgi:hypothetical protein
MRQRHWSLLTATTLLLVAWVACLFLMVDVLRMFA